MDTLQSRALTASQTLNDVTGYSGIEAIKAENTKLESALAEAHERLRAARAAYKSSNTKRAATQREVTTLLARKDGWTPTDLERFTELYRTDHVLEGEVVAAQERLTEAEAEEQSLGQRLNAGILKRYHEEQIWSDRIRRASTWGTWGLMGMNFLLFLVLQFVAEPWRRRRLVKGVVEEEKQVLEEVRAELEGVKSALARREEALMPVQIPLEPSSSVEEAPAVVEVHPPPLSWAELLSDPSRWRTFAVDLASQRKVELTMREASILALEGVVAGAAVAGTVALLVVRG
jgi:sensitive to high expression protein 9